ncbi:MAG: hypothetical protein ACRC7G_04210 [Beijerinckiaceae bacterium]
MNDISLTANTRAALNLGEAGASQGFAVAALKVAANADKAVVQIVEQAAESLRAIPPAGQGQQVDRSA